MKKEERDEERGETGKARLNESVEKKKNTKINKQRELMFANKT